MAIPPGGGVPPPRPPTLEEIVKIFRVAKNFTMTQDFPGDKINVRFTISKEDCEAENIQLHTFGSQFLGELWDHLDQLSFFNELTARFADSAADLRYPGKATTAADCAAFMNNEMKFCNPTGLEGTMRRRMYATIIEKLQELQEWRVFMDREKFKEQRERARRQKEQMDEMKRRAQEDIRRAQEEIRRQQEQAKQQKREQTSPPPGGGFGGFYDNPFGNNGPYEEVFGDKFRQYYEEHFRRANFGHGFKGGRDSYSWGPETNSNGEDPQGRRRKQDKVKPKGKWWEILGVTIDANKATIKSAWRKKCKIHHPDRGGSNEMMAEINAAKDEGLAGAAS